MKPDEFIDCVLIADIGKVINADCAYLAFGLISQGIETLGAILDEQEIHNIGNAESRFRNAIQTLFKWQGSLYPKYASADSEYDLFKYLRCGMTHVLRPAGKIGFTTRKESTGNGTKHMEVSKETGQLILVIEDFYSDFEKACIKCKNLIPKKSHSKLKDDYIICSQVASGGS